MSLSDPIADLLTLIRNASMARHQYVEVPASKIKVGICKILKEQGFIAQYLVNDQVVGGLIRIFLKYDAKRDPVIRGLKRVSKPSVRRTTGYRDIPRVLGGMGIAIVSTPLGLKEGKDAIRSKVGGEILAYVW